jgi:hypothetical protein
MNIVEGKTEEWIAASPSGRIVSTFGSEKGARDFLEERPERANLRLFCRETDTVELER